MINYFLNERDGLTSNKRKLITKHFLSRRKYNPFHLDCEFTKKKLCYCQKNPISHLTEGQKAELWTNSYMEPYEFFARDPVQTNIVKEPEQSKMEELKTVTRKETIKDASKEDREAEIS
jgi:hypothetical protein